MSELYELPEGWEWKAIDKFAIIKSGKRVPKGKKLVENITPYPYIRVTDFSDNGTVDISNIRYITEDIYQQIKNYTITDNDIYISVAGTIGKTGIIPKELNGANLTENAVKIVFDNDEYDKRFIYNFTNSITFMEQIGLATKTVAMPKLAIKRLKEVKVPLPPLQEQKRIVAKLDTLFEKIDRAIALHQKNMDEADAFMGSVLNDVFGELEGKYEKKKLESFDKKMSSGGTPSRKEKIYWNGTIEWFSSGELNQLYTLPSREKITQIAIDKTSAKLFFKGTLLIGMYDTAAMKMSILSNNGSCNQAIVGFKPKEDELNIFFIKYQLEYLKKEILEQRQGVRQQNLNLTKIKNILIEYPPLQIQQKTVNYLDEISSHIQRVKELQKEKLEHLKALKASILDQAFRGKL